MATLRFSSISKQGKRSKNEDSFSILDNQQENCWMGIVCDGMGGHTHGEVASQLVVDVITTYWKNHLAEPDTPEKVVKACKKASHQFDEKVYELGHIQMGTTMVMASIQDDLLTIAHLGDSRCYYLDSSRKPRYITNDHVTHKDGFEKITKCFFSYYPSVAIPEIRQFKVSAGDTLLLCTDGIYKYMSHSSLLGVIGKSDPPEEAMNKLIDLCAKLSQDNYTAILLKVVET